jgi:diguanylate cyclase (GGDEF)-like protein
LPATIDVTLTVPALTAVAVANDAPIAAALSTVALLVIARGFTSERRGRLVEHHHATHDPLTGLANRLLLDELADAASERARREQHSCGLLLADLDAFKAINDSHGHAAGDQVLVGAAARLRARVRAVDTVARVGGDEFAVLLSGAQTQETCVQVARELHAAIAVPFDLPGGPYEVGVSIGYALLDGDRSLADALREADGAMYAVKPATAPRRDPTRPLAGEAQRA